jgi:hypothetical protein
MENVMKTILFSAAVSLLLGLGVAYAASENYEAGVTGPVSSSSSGTTGSSENYFVGSNSQVREQSNVNARDTGSDETPIFAGQGGTDNRAVVLAARAATSQLR